MGGSYAVGVDVGGTKIEAALVDRSGTELARKRVDSPREREALLQVCAALVREVAGDAVLAGVGFSIPGSLDPRTGILRNAPNMPHLAGRPFGADLAARLPWPVVLENDANCLALSERAFGAARGRDHVCGIILGTGVGSGVIIGGRLLTGAHGLASEIGHVPLFDHAVRCACGRTGCVEAFLSGPAHVRRYRAAGGDPGDGGAEVVFARADTEAIARRVVMESMQLFVRLVVALVDLYDPEIVVLGGGLSHQPGFYAQSRAIEPMLPATASAPAIVPAERGDASGKLGAAALAFERALA